MSLTNSQAIDLLSSALTTGRILRLRGYDYDFTAGPNQTAIDGALRWSAFDYSPRKVELFESTARDLACELVRHVGRGVAAQVARKALCS